MSERTCQVLFLCTGNSARSVAWFDLEAPAAGRPLSGTATAGAALPE